MTCDQSHLLFTDLYEDALPAVVKLQAEHHLVACAMCSGSYARFSMAMTLLDEPVAELEAPQSLRANVLARIAELPDPAASTLPRRSFALWSFFDHRQVKLAISCVSAILIVGLAALDLSTPGPNVSSGVATGVPPPPNIAYNYRGPFQGFSVTSKSGKVYHNFSFQLPPGLPSASVSAYILQDDRALADDEALSDTTSASLAWTDSQPLVGNESISIPIAVVSDIPDASTLALLIKCTGEDGNAKERKDVAFVPLDNFRRSVAIPRGSNLLTVLRAAAASQDINIILDDSAVRSLASNSYAAPAGVDGASPLSALIAEQTRLVVIPHGGNTYAIVAP